MKAQVQESKSQAHLSAHHFICTHTIKKTPNSFIFSSSHSSSAPMADTSSKSSSSSSITDNSTSNCFKKARIADSIDEEEEEDVISSLPDEVLCHILSFIPTKHAVATSVLSKRWKLVWTSIPNLDFTLNYPVNQSTSMNFMNFVDRVLSLNNVVHVRKVYLDCTDYCDSSRVKAWISAIVGRHTKDFSLSIPRSCCIRSLDQFSRMISLSDSFFVRENLVELRLDYIALKVPTLVNFPNVKTIRLDYVQFIDDDSMKNLLAGCPVLEKLNLERGLAWDNAQTLYICSSSLSYLQLQQTQYCDNKNSGYKVVIEAPKLCILALRDYVNVDYDMKNVSSLVTAYVDFARDDGDAYNERLYEFFRKISHIRYLELYAYTMLALKDAFFVNLPKFNNLTSLKVELVESWPVLPYLFNCSPNLVTFRLTLEEEGHTHCEWYEPQSVPQCLLSSLENIRITGLQECDAAMEMIYYFLNNAMVLKKMVIKSIDLDMKTEIDICKLLVDFPRSSSTCQVEYSNYIRKAWP